MRNITLTVDDEVALWARVYAARQGRSVSRVLGEILREKMLEEEGYADAMRRFLEAEPAKLKGRAQRYPSRDEIHER
ncbi:MAG: hypothetical protein IT385_08955 [Deltaproteobacteria bacterium]|nr:hypothetical protein [Deltaproteobacteria bacterium]